MTTTNPTFLLQLPKLEIMPKFSMIIPTHITTLVWARRLALEMSLIKGLAEQIYEFWKKYISLTIVKIMKKKSFRYLSPKF